jgi:hypothetical protein
MSLPLTGTGISWLAQSHYKVTLLFLFYFLNINIHNFDQELCGDDTIVVTATTT